MSATDRINHLNIGLMLLAFGMAFYLPIELFVIVYALLGPLHYLTEISWLHDRKYFVGPNKGTALFWVLPAILSVLSVAHLVYPHLQFNSLLMHLSSIAVIVGLGWAILLNANTGGKIPLAQALCCITACAIVVDLIPGSTIFFAALVTTIVHVFVFTWFFMLAGAIKEGRFSGFLAVGVLTVCAAFILAWTPDSTISVATAWIDRFKLFGRLDLLMANYFGLRDANHVIGLLRFIAFAYTYHYFNWFSKTKIIKWHAVPRRRLVLMLSMYVASVAIYLINYKLGLAVLFFLSVGHVFLEFPLNLKTIAFVLQHLTQGADSVPAGQAAHVPAKVHLAR